MEVIKRKCSVEELVSRVCGLFPYITVDDGAVSAHSAKESSCGCYGHMIPDLIVPFCFSVDDNVLITSGLTYSYRYIMYVYYRYRKDFPDDDFIKFIDGCVGNVKVDRNSLGLSDYDKYPLVPDEFPIAAVPIMIADMEKLKEECSNYETLKDCDTCEKCLRYGRMGGDVFLEYLNGLLPERDRRCDELLGIVANDVPSVNFDLSITSKYIDLGVMAPYDVEWEAGKRYYCGDIVEYNGVTYVCVLNHVVHGPCTDYGNLCQYTLCENKLYVYNDNIHDYEPHDLRHLCSLLIVDLCDITDEYIEVDGIYYALTSDGYAEINVCEYSTGIYDENTGIISFDYAHFMPLNDYVSHYGTYGNTPTDDEEQEWYCANNPFGDKYKIFVDCETVPTENIHKRVRVDGVVYIWSDADNGYVVDPDNGFMYRIEGCEETALSSLRSGVNFIGVNGVEVTPDKGWDFLFYYRIGNVSNVSVANDEATGNILRMNNNMLSVGDVADDLYAYGDVLYDIRVFPDERRVRFYYVLGAHLKSVCMSVETDDFMRLIYKYDNTFTYDEDDTHGVRYYEDWYYAEGGDVDALVNNGDFYEYVTGAPKSEYVIKDTSNGVVIIDNVNVEYLPSNVYNPNTLPTPYTIPYMVTVNSNQILGDFWRLNDTSTVYNLCNGDIVIHNYKCDAMLLYSPMVSEVVEVGSGFDEYNYVKSCYSEDVNVKHDMLYSPLFRYDHMVGIEYRPDIREDVLVGRGNAASVERHVSLGDIKTVEDMDNYRNGGFWNVKNID